MKTTHSFLAMKEKKEPISMVTAYDFPSAQLSAAAGIDILLVGDSLGMVVLGYDSTVPVTIEDMIHHGKAVRRGAPETFIVTDMPYMSYHSSLERTMENARHLMQQTGSNALKLEGSGAVIEKIAALVEAGVPIVGHLGLTPQSAGVLGGFKVQGRDASKAQKLVDDALAIEAAGACMLVLECVPHQVTKLVTEALTIPVIGIGAGQEADGQVLVYHDLLSYGFHHVPKFVKQYATVSHDMVRGLKQFHEEVKAAHFPQSEHSFTMKDEEVEALYGGKS
ncbi:3-methyl-2-oxobutanoate hydroxymethyltransferase [Fictibacillus macauensis ZFHKF-1]|uniref:3-methyl-2-oxobutanoate hydroxymethyltransferase n=1 Tax=Fictibacillus macauensis ZFHKF-1 TaxID=1196324 RepID=I8AL69_9BACL|nr:3-methyl-2-oxobutanoate hydroxymethyltransferase [Fictibacillus macauensis]EIT86617.1 3-methyl-2-oxobutanoate hydroxymethyltransferase [Fictibacillus macauensis ZFHKF-1]